MTTNKYRVDAEATEINPDSLNRTGMIPRLRELAIHGLERMYLPEKKLFVFRTRRAMDGIISEGFSRRYTAIALIGLAGEEKKLLESVLAGHNLQMVCERLKEEAGHVDNPGDAALILWAACATGYPDRREIRKRLLDLLSVDKAHPVVEVSWALDALCMNRESRDSDLIRGLAQRLSSSFNERSSVFPHVLGENNNGPRSHVSCFADMVYPIHALASYFKFSGDRIALDIATRCAEKICELQGPEGQWWWHYDLRTGNVIEPYPVYSVHQDAMAPMALFALHEAGGPDFYREIQKGLDWLAYSPEIRTSLIDEKADLIWRKVARREPGKLSRYTQAIASRLHPSLRMPGMDIMFPPGLIDYENRPYHLGWILYAWPKERFKTWNSLA